MRWSHLFSSTIRNQATDRAHRLGQTKTVTVYKLIMKDCSTMIIICGQDESLSTSKNVLDQFHQFMADSETGAMPLIIPLPSTGFAAKEIFMSEEFNASSCYRENPQLYQRINVCSDPEQLAKLVVNLIASYRMEPTV